MHRNVRFLWHRNVRFLWSVFCLKSSYGVFLWNLCHPVKFLRQINVMQDFVSVPIDAIGSYGLYFDVP